MPTVYGAWTPNASTNQRMRLRVDYSVPSVSAGQSSVTVTGSVHIEVRFGLSDSDNTFTMGGTLGPSASGARSINVPTDGSQQLQTFSQSVTLAAGTQSRTLTASLTGIEYVGISRTASVSASITIPARVVQVPNVPTSVSHVRTADNRHTVEWAASVTEARPVTNFRIERYRQSANSWELVATVSGTARSWVDTTNMPNDRVRYSVRAQNSAGNSNFGTPTAWTATTPAAATNLSVSRSGQDAFLSWTRNNRVTTGPPAAHQDIQAQSSPPGSSAWSGWQDIGHNGIAPTATSRTISGLDPTLRWRFRVQTAVTSPLLYAQSGASPILQLLTRPNPPTLLGPSGVSSSQTFASLRWRHEPVDGSPQSAAEVQWRAVGASAWTTQAKPAAATEHSVTLAPGMWEWRARTKGSHADWSNWSPVRTFQVAEPPTVWVTTPEDGASISANRITAQLGYTDAQSAPMTSWTATLLDGSSQEIATRTGTGWVVTFPNVVLEDQSTYTLQVTALSGTGLRSATDQVTIHTSFTPPAPAHLIAEWLGDQGLVSMTVQAEPPGWPVYDLGEGAYGLPVPVTYLGGGEYQVEGATVTHVGDGVYTVDASDSYTSGVTFRVERSDDSGMTWRVIADDLPAGSGVLDTRVALNHEAIYRAISISDLGVETASEDVVVATPSDRIWLGLDDGTLLSLQLNMSISENRGHTRVAEYYMGRSRATSHFGEARPLTVAIAGTLLAGYGLEHDFSELLGTVLWYRDPERRAMLAAITDGYATQQTNNRVRTISMTLEAEHNGDA